MSGIRMGIMKINYPTKTFHVKLVAKIHKFIMLELLKSYEMFDRVKLISELRFVLRVILYETCPKSIKAKYLLVPKYL